MNDADLLDLHRRIVAIPSPSKSETEVLEFLETYLAGRGVAVERLGRNIVARLGRGPYLCLNSHVDTVPASPRWTRAPHDVRVESGRVFGLGSNDAKASVAAMLAAFLRLQAAPEGTPSVMLMLVCDEETGGQGTEFVLPELARRGERIAAAVIGEPTGLDIAVAQKGLMVLELLATGRACHAAHARALGAANAIRELARDVVALEGLEFEDDADLGPTTLEPTLLTAGTAKNMVPAEAVCTVDVRTNPAPGHEAVVAAVRERVRASVRVVSTRLKAKGTAQSEAVVRAATTARPEARLFGSRGLSDWVFFDGIPAVKVGPGATERSHTADEFVYESEVIEGARFYEALARRYAGLGEGEKSHDAALGSR